MHVTWLLRRSGSLACLLTGLLFSGAVWAKPASMTLYVFKRGLPVENIEVLVDGTVVAATNDKGVVVLQIEPGLRQLELRDQDLLVLDQPVLALEDEISQWIVNITRGLSTLTDVETTGVQGGGEPVEDTETATGNLPGMLRGRLLNIDDGAPVVGARIFVSGQPTDLRSDENGAFQLEIPAGRYSISVLHSGFNTVTRSDVEVTSEESNSLEIELTPSGSELPEFLVIEPYIEGSLASVLAERRESEGVTDVLSAEQISRSGDSDAAGALKRVTGLTLVGGQYIYVRGLGERYSSVLLNNAAVPSPDPTRRVVPLSLFPTDVIKAVVVQKTGSAPLPGQFGGGTVQLRTVSFPETFTANFSASTAYRDGTTFETGLGYEGGGNDWLGVDDGTRDLPESLATAIAGGMFLRPRSFTNPDGFTREEIEVFGEDVAAKSSYDLETRDLPPGLGLSGALGNSFDFFGGGRWGFMTAFKYDNQWANINEIRRDYSATDDGLQRADDVEIQRTINQIDTGLFANFGFSLPAGHDVGFNAMLLRQTEDETRVTEGVQDSQQVRRFLFEWIENELLSYQAVGAHSLPFFDDWTLDWQFTDATAGRDEPNTRRYRRDDDDGDGVYIVSTRSDSNSQTWSQLEDDLNNWSVDTQLPFRFGRHELTLGAGLNDIQRDRLASIRTFTFQGRIPRDLRELSYADLYTPTYIGEVVDLRETTRATDTYTASQTLEAWYVNLDLALWDEALRITAGMRSEDNLQTVETANLANPNAPPVIGEIDEVDELPSAAITWAYSQNAQLRLAYAESVNRPDFREQAPAPYLDPLLDIVTVGNPDLKTAKLKNYDLRWEYYFSPSENVSVAAFYKDFTDPIEKTFSSGGSAKIITLQNALSADLYGVELDYSQSLSWISGVSWLNWLDEFEWKFLGPFDWDNLNFAFNYAWIESTVTIDSDNTTQTNTDRPLQGQSPWVVNLQFGYYNPDSPNEWTLLYNEFGKRISQAGVLGQPDIYEQPFPQLDFVYKRRFLDDWRFSLKFKNLLDAKVEFTQGSETTRVFEPGWELSLGISRDF